MEFTRGEEKELEGMESGGLGEGKRRGLRECFILSLDCYSYFSRCWVGGWRVVGGWVVGGIVTKPYPLRLWLYVLRQYNQCFRALWCRLQILDLLGAGEMLGLGGTRSCLSFWMMMLRYSD